MNSHKLQSSAVFLAVGPGMQTRHLPFYNIQGFKNDLQVYAKRYTYTREESEAKLAYDTEYSIEANEC